MDIMEHSLDMEDISHLEVGEPDSDTPRLSRPGGFRPSEKSRPTKLTVWG